MLWAAAMRAQRSEVAVFALAGTPRTTRPKPSTAITASPAFGSLPRQFILPLASVTGQRARN